MREELACAHPLANAISRLPLESGHARIFATENMSIAQLLRLRENPFASDEDGRACWRSFQNYVTNYLRSGSRCTFIMGNPYITRDCFLQRLQRIPLRLGREWSDWFLCATHVGFYVTEAADERRMHDFYNDIQALTTFGVLTHDVKLPLHGELPVETLDRTVAQADYIVVGAYEDIGALIWSRQVP